MKTAPLQITAPAEPPPGPEVPEVPDTAPQGPDAPKTKNAKCKRKRNSALEHTQVLEEVRGNLLPATLPPLMHTPLSMFEMLCASFEDQFPNHLPESLKNEVLQSLRHSVLDSSVRASAAT